MRDHFIDNGSNFKDPVDLVKRLDQYEAVKRPPKKMWNPKSPFEKKTGRARNAW